MSNWTKEANSQSKDDLSASSEKFGSSDNLSEGKDAKEDLTADPELSTSGDNPSEKTSKGGVMGKILKNPFQSSAWERSEQPADASEKLLAEEPKAKKQEKGPDSDGKEQNPDSQSAPKQYEKHSGSDEEPAGDEKTSSNKQKDTGQAETGKEVEKKQGEERREKSKPVKSTPTPREKTERSGPPSVPVKPAKEDNKTMALRQKEKVASAAAGPTEEAKVQKPKRHNPFMPRVPDKDQSDDDLNKDAEGTGQAVAAKPKTAKKHNPFLPRVRPKKNPQEELSAADNAAENEDMSLFDRLEDLIDRDEPVDQVRPKKNPQEELSAADNAAEP
ncbi:hypothetical protein CRUP_007216 [Coryphaenoides rupestris]|nr:hypothetical protein CRUP_007216 [Coryphaenoides rupestris]